MAWTTLKTADEKYFRHRQPKMNRIGHFRAIFVTFYRVELGYPTNGIFIQKYICIHQIMSKSAVFQPLSRIGAMNF